MPKPGVRADRGRRAAAQASRPPVVAGDAVPDLAAARSMMARVAARHMWHAERIAAAPTGELRAQRRRAYDAEREALDGAMRSLRSLADWLADSATAAAQTVTIAWPELPAEWSSTDRVRVE
jgi:hypothetical protein